MVSAASSAVASGMSAGPPGFPIVDATPITPGVDAEVAALSVCAISALSPSQAITVIEQKTIAENDSIEDRNESETFIDSIRMNMERQV
jgi:hypothetical protein